MVNLALRHGMSPRPPARQGKSHNDLPFPLDLPIGQVARRVAAYGLTSYT